MSPGDEVRQVAAGSAPRVSGDEPLAMHDKFGALGCSPRERG